jgi:FkbM family methyltransferase
MPRPSQGHFTQGNGAIPGSRPDGPSSGGILVQKQVKGIWLPDTEEHLIPHIEKGPEFAGAGTYQLLKFQAAFVFIKNFRHAVDIGAHVGLWSRVLARCFTRLTAFEPIELHRDLFNKNVRADSCCEIKLYPFALSDSEESLRFDIDPKSSGATHVTLAQGGTGPQVAACTLDSVDLPPVDFVKIDCEGYEYFILKGGERIIRRDQPCIIVEQKPGKGSMYGIDDREAVKLLQSWGAQLRFEISGDFCLSW